MVLIAARPGGTDDEVAVGVPVLHLRPFLEKESAGIIAALLPNANPFLLQEIQIQAGGSPLYIEELCHSIAAGGALQSAERKSGRAAWINSMVASRVSRLPEDQVVLLQFASVIGNAFPCWLLERLTGHSEKSPMVTALTAHDFLFPSSHAGMLRFKHALTRDAVYNTVDPHRRRSIHLKVAETLREEQTQVSANDSVESLAYHCDAAGLHLDAARYSETSGDKAMSAMALDSARAHYVTALRALDKLATLERDQKIQWCTIAQKLGMACVFDPLDLPNGMALFERAGQLAVQVGEPNLIARAEYWLGYMTYAKGLLRSALKHCDNALAFATDTNDARLTAQVKATLGQIWVSAGNYERALPLMDEAVEVKKQSSRPGSRVAIGSAYTLARKAYMLGDQGRFELAHECFEDSLGLVANSVHPIGASIWELISAVYIWQGRWAEAIAAAKTGADVALRCRTRSLTAMGRALGASALWASTKGDAAFNTLREATQWIEARGGAISNSLNYGWLVHASVERQDTAMARHYAARLIQQSRSLDRHGEGLGRRALARMALTNGDSATARRHLEKAMSIATLRGAEHEHASNLLSQADLAFHGSRHSAAFGLIDDACARFDRLGMTWHLDEAKKRKTSAQIS
jgi:tetratricopeptide (TPR) repeat protein